MAINLNLSTKLAQQLRITPQLQQAIKLLQLSRLDLESTVRKELNENPILEEIHETEEEDPAKNTQQMTEELQSPDTISPSDQDPRKDDDFNWENYLDSSYNKLSGNGAKESFDEVTHYENRIPSPKSLKDYLTWQVNLSGFNQEEEAILSVLISYINDDGYIKIELEEISKNESLSLKSLEEMIPFLHELDPPGIGARNLKECLLIQAKHLEEDTHDLIYLINHHLKDFEKRDFLRISKATKWSMNYIKDLHQIILEMDPKPGLSYVSEDDVQYITPDVYVYQKSDEYVISLNEDGLPRLQISNSYKHLLKANIKSTNKKTKDYIQEKLRSAIWLIKSIQQRQKTIYKVAESIVKHQKEFLDKGSSYIRPMVLRDIANDIGMHESTVSRVTTAKYIHTPQGIYELKYFFNSGIRKYGGEAIANESIKLKIKDLVAKEDLKRPLSDQKIMELLDKEGIKIARRTVAKYRDVLRILPSSKRKKFF